MNRKRLAIAATLGLGLAALAEGGPEPSPDGPKASVYGAVEPGTLRPLEAHPRTSLSLLDQLRHNHYLQKSLDDSASSAILDNYLEMLDGARVFFLAGDIQEMERHRHGLDDALKQGNLQPAFEIFNLYQMRLAERFEFLIEVLEAGINGMDFTADEWVEADRRQAPWPADWEAANELWRKRLKAAALNMKLNGKEFPEIQELLVKRYRNRLKQVRQTKSEDAFQLYVNAFASTYDPHTQYFSPRTSQNFNINMSLSLEGIGAVLRSEDEYTYVVRLVPAGPADKVGQLKPADRILSVGQGEDGPLIDVVGWRLDDVVELIRGPKGSKVRLEVAGSETDHAAAKVVQIVRNTVELEEQAASKHVLTLNRDGLEYRIGLVEIPTFYVDFQAAQEWQEDYKSTTRDVRALVAELKAEGVDGLILDLRNNGGGSLQEADSLTGLFIESGPTVQVKAAKRRPKVFSGADERAVWDGPLAVMVNRLSASASEIFAGAIQDYGRGILVGSQTFGKGTVQTLIPLNRGQLKVTAAKFYRVSGRSTQHQGVLPDIEFPELHDAHRIGESSLEDAMPWDMIQPVVHFPAGGIQPLLAALRSRHEQRVADNPDFIYLRALAAKSREYGERERFSLNEAARRAELAEEEAWRLDLENALRRKKGKPELASLDALDSLAEEQPFGPEDDPLLMETGQILLDFMGLERQIAAVGRDAEVLIQ